MGKLIIALAGLTVSVFNDEVLFRRKAEENWKCHVCEPCSLGDISKGFFLLFFLRFFLRFIVRWSERDCDFVHSYVWRDEPSSQEDVVVVFFFPLSDHNQVDYFCRLWCVLGMFVLP